MHVILPNIPVGRAIPVCFCAVILQKGSVGAQRSKPRKAGANVIKVSDDKDYKH